MFDNKVSLGRAQRNGVVEIGSGDMSVQGMDPFGGEVSEEHVAPADGGLRIYDNLFTVREGVGGRESAFAAA